MLPSLFIFAILVSLSWSQELQIQQEIKPRQTLDVYYESLCPDSRRLLLNQLTPSWKQLSSFVNLRLIPFGKASFTAKPEGGWNFECQHGPDECAGNILHACGIKYSTNSDQALQFASCLMNFPDQGQQCAATAGLDYSAVSRCQRNGEGENLVHDHGVETLNLNPQLTFVPWIVYNGKWDYDNQWNGLKNIKSIACRAADDLPSVCLAKRR